MKKLGLLFFVISLFMTLCAGIIPAPAAEQKIAAGGRYTITLKTDGTLWAWGSNSFGQLGIGTADVNAHPTPVQIGTDTTWSTVKAGNSYTSALKTDGTLWAWGYNEQGQLGDGTTIDRHAPVQILYTLTINTAGTGTGTVGGGGSYSLGTTQPITATAGANSTFTGWSGDCSGTTSPLDVLIDSNKTCTATFQKKFPWSVFLPAITNNQ